MSMTVQISAGGVDAAVRASGGYNPDVMEELNRHARESFTHAVRDAYAEVTEDETEEATQ